MASSTCKKHILEARALAHIHSRTRATTRHNDEPWPLDGMAHPHTGILLRYALLNVWREVVHENTGRVSLVGRTVARLGWAARMGLVPGCLAAWLPGCPAAWLPGRTAARLPGCPVARLPDFLSHGSMGISDGSACTRMGPWPERPKVGPEIPELSRQFHTE